MPEPRQRLAANAYLEAGHAVLALQYGRRVKRVTIQPTEDTDGHVDATSGVGLLSYEGEFTPRAQRRIEERVKIQLAGQVAQRQYAPRSEHVYQGRYDRANAIILLEKVTDSEEELRAYLKLLHIQTTQIVKQPLIWAKIAAVAEALLKQRTLSGDEVMDIATDAVDKLLSSKLAATP